MKYLTFTAPFIDPKRITSTVSSCSSSTTKKILKVRGVVGESYKISKYFCISRNVTGFQEKKQTSSRQNEMKRYLDLLLHQQNVWCHQTLTFFEISLVFLVYQHTMATEHTPQKQDSFSKNHPSSDRSLLVFRGGYHPKRRRGELHDIRIGICSLQLSGRRRLVFCGEMQRW